MRFLLLVFLCFSANMFSQDLSIFNCLSGSNGELLKSKENIDANNYLLNIRSNSNNGYFPRLDFVNDTLYNYPSSWLLKLNENGDTIWNRRLPNSENAMYVQYFYGWTGPIPFPVADFTNNIYTKLDDEIILHYAYYDSLNLKIKIGDSIGNLPNLISFGILDINDGNYKVAPFIIDTLKLINPNANTKISSCYVNKINDSIYQLATEYSENELYYSNVNIDVYLNFYTININSKSVIKQSYEGYYNKLISVENRFYILQGSYFTDSTYTINKIKLDGTIELTKPLNIRHKAPDISYINALGNGMLLLGGSQEVDSNATTRNDAVLYKINLADLSFSTTYYNNYPNNINSNSNFLPLNVEENNYYINQYEINSNYKGTNSSSPYCYYNESLQNDSGYIITKNYFTKLDLATGNVLWKKNIEASVVGINLDENEIIGFNDSTFSAPIFNTFHHNSVQKYDSNFNLVWNTILPDSILVDSIVYFPNSGISSYFPIDYNNQFFIALKYIDSSNSNYYLDEWFYFLVSKTNGNLKRIELKHNQIPITFDSYDIVGLAFFNTPNNNLSIIADGLNKCDDASNLDVVIYKYNEIISSIKTNKVITQGDFVLFPNPTNNNINIQFNVNQEIKDATLKIMDISGRIMYDTKLQNTQQLQIDVAELPNGMYFLQIDAENLHQTKKFQVLR